MPDIFTTNEHEWLNRRYTTVAGITCLILLGLLAACGGGNTDPVATTAPTAATSTASEGKVTILAVPPGWGGRVPGSEVINGITVPPEPAPSVNNATIAGVDLNKNGVRDDVERKIAQTLGKDLTKYTQAITFAQIEQAMVTVSSSANVQAMIKQVVCNPLTSNETGPGTALLLNTRERDNAYSLAMAGAVLTGSCN